MNTDYSKLDTVSVNHMLEGNAHHTMDVSIFCLLLCWQYTGAYVQWALLQLILIFTVSQDESHRHPMAGCAFNMGMTCAPYANLVSAMWHCTLRDPILRKCLWHEFYKWPPWHWNIRKKRETKQKASKEHASIVSPTTKYPSCEKRIYI